ncbi:MAG TPA: CNP1-like family protein [Noviherbaspirillum sp.]|uniref:CNP1-like family protein n=1 Tax=Noviherbaspirillum sp. TaxID=1926288 RepID=UPI002B4A6607|nr:CNP1-like family protein [Noviherbaspirillum sp.]HJV88081.1 CNP1-like family protein [Noviherbaspirillum sp.]
MLQRIRTRPQVGNLHRQQCRNRLFHAAAAICLLSASLAASAQSRFEEDFDDTEKPWEEVALQLPRAPKQENLLPFYVSPTATQNFAIDAGSLTVGSDGVIRYTLVATSAAGARNISYEGIRCASFERKLYAFGQANGTWSRSRRDKWERIDSNAANRQHAVLYKDYFCDGVTVAGNAKDMINRIRYDKPLTSPNEVR